MRTRHPLLTIAAVAAVGLAGCGGDDAGDDVDAGTTAEEPTTGTDEATEDAAGEGPTVTVRDIAFQEQTVTVDAGTPVTWVNEDDVAHTVTSGTPDSPTDVFDEQLPAGDEVTITVEEPGTYPYFCAIHPNMTAELVVE